jgi:acetyl-CoA acetyltransferase
LIIGGKRTAIGSYLGSLANIPATELGSIAISAAISQSGKIAYKLIKHKCLLDKYEF